MKNLIGIILAALAVPAVLNVIMNRNVKNSTKSLNDFCMKPPGEAAVIGAALIVFIGLTAILTFRNGQMKTVLTVITALLLALGVFLMLLPVNGFWSVSVKGDRVRSSRLWVFVRTLDISGIDHCVRDRNGMIIYGKDDIGVTISVEGICTNFRNLEQRMKKEGIEVR
ncbi:MAG: hypothetical protein IJH92_05890 [Mogibacterium sp.]|nr:hypothetical protein [Mogibacterium sp.]